MSSPYEAPSGVPTPPPGSYMPPAGYGPPPPPDAIRQRGLLHTVGLASAILLAVAALVIALVALNRPAASTSATSQASSVTSPSTSTASDTTAADRKLCEAVGPLLRESNETGKAFVNLGVTGTPARDAGIEGYETSVLDWLKRIQPVLDSHPGADPYLRRMLQRMVDDIHSYATTIRPGPATDPDSAAWNDATVAYGGPFDVCHRLGVEW